MPSFRSLPHEKPRSGPGGARGSRTVLLTAAGLLLAGPFWPLAAQSANSPASSGGVSGSGSPANGAAAPAEGPGAGPGRALPKLPEVQQALAALRDKLPEVAVLKLRRVLETPGRLNAGRKSPVILLLAESLVRAGKWPEALALLEERAGEISAESRPEADFWRAQALARLDRWGEAETIFGSLGRDRHFRYAAEAAFSRAGMLAAMGSPDQAIRILEPLLVPAGTSSAIRARLWMAELRLETGHPDEATALLQGLPGGLPPVPPAPPPGTESARAAAGTEEASGPGSGAAAVRDPSVLPEARYLQGRIALAAGDPATAGRIFEVLASSSAAVSGASPPAIPAPLRQAARLGRARALRAEGKTTEALSVLRQVVAGTPVPPPGILDSAFQEIESLNHPPTADMESFLTSLAANPEPAIRLRARIALAAALESVADPKQAEAAWAAVPKDFPDHPLRALALLRQAQFLAAHDRRAEALPILDQLRQLSPTPRVAAWSAWVAGRSAYDAAAYRKASASFLEAAAKSPDPATRAAAAYNAALAELQSGISNPARSLALLDGSTLEEYRMAGAEFHLERALRLASLGDEEAVAGLEAFAESLPNHPRRFDALIALAEVALRSDPPRLPEASQHLQAAEAAAVTPPQKERAALLGCYLAGEAQGPDAFAARATGFLTDYPASAARTDLRMKMARLYYQRENYSGARKLFETIAGDDPLHPLSEPALFWAGRAALLSLEPTADQQAMMLWEKVYEKGGPLRWQARLQEALLNQRQRKPAAALQLLDEILAASPPPDSSTRWQALSIRGELLAAPGTDAASQAQGLEAFDEVLAVPDLPSAWHRRTLVRKGVALEALGRTDEALEAYYDVLAALPHDPVAGNQPGDEDYWFHRAGNKALRLLEAAGKTEEAIEIAKKMAKAPGPRGRAAAELVDELALKYGIWTGSP